MDSPSYPEWFSERNALLQRISELEEENRLDICWNCC